MISLLLSCSSPRPAAVPADQARVYRLEALPFAELVVPEHNRPDGTVPERIALHGPWHRDSDPRKAHRGWTAPIPIRPRGLFFYRPEAGIRVLDTADGDAEIRFEDDPDGSLQWAHDRESITIWTDSDDPPADGRFVLVYPTATERETALNWKPSNKPAEEFVWTQVTEGWDARRGLLLPAPGTAAWELDVPPAAELTFDATVVEPEIRDAPDSDGARIVVEVDADGATTEAWSGAVAPRSHAFERVDLSRWSGKHVKLRVRSETAGNPVFDYVFLGEPAVASRKADPVKVVMVFIDTLRVDHLSLYGYARDTSAAIDGLAGSSAVFESAYTVAPWTLPSAQSIVTGRQPEEYRVAQTLPELLDAAGFANAFFAGNVYLSSNFGMDRGWDLHRVGGLWPRAEQPTDDALKWLEDHDGRDVLVQVHYMDAHLPYLEPRAYRHKYAGAAHPKLGERFELNDVRRAGVEQDDEAKQYIQDRYDNNIAYATDQIARIVATLDDNDVLLVYADHGEEFWDHGHFEHGHSLFRELLHVPLLIHAPGVPAARISEPVSLLDLAPTVLDLVGQPIPEEMDGRSLVALTRGDAEAKAAFAARDQAFGRPLYGMEQWGVLHDDHAWMTTEGREALYDLALDPDEKKNLLLNDDTDSGAPYRERLAGALGREVKVGYRLTPTTYRGGRPELGLVAICSIPGGFADVWPGADPLKNSFAAIQPLEDPATIEQRLAQFQIPNHSVAADAAGVEICWPPGFYGSREVYLVPARPLGEVGPQMVCSAFLGGAQGGKRATVTFPRDREPGLSRVRVPLNKILFDQRQLVWQWGIGPLPGEGAIVGTDSEADGMLVQLGYLEREGTAPLPEGERDEAPRACEPPEVQLAPLPPAPEPRDPAPARAAENR